MSDADDGSREPLRSGRVKKYFKHLFGTICDAPFTSGTWLYLVIVLFGGAAATWFIPFINASHTSAETLGIYVIGILIAVFADALFLWKKSKDDLIAETILIFSFILSFVVVALSVKVEVAPGGEKRWRSYSELVIYLILLVSILMWAMINVVEPRLSISATDTPASISHLSGK